MDAAAAVLLMNEVMQWVVILALLFVVGEHLDDEGRSE